VFLVYEIIRYIAMAMQQVIVDISQINVSFDSTSLVSMVLSSNKVSSSSRGFCMAKVTAHAEKNPIFL
jgi:predicted aspartyl protease